MTDPVELQEEKNPLQSDQRWGEERGGGEEGEIL